MGSSFKDFSSDHLDVFREIGSIGAGNAATALASLLGKRMGMSVPTVKILPFNEITDILNGPENIVAGVMIHMSGDLSGYILFVLDAADARRMVSVLTSEEFDPSSEASFESIDLSALTEIANILVGAYLSAISSMTGLTIIPSVPALSVDMAAAIMSVVAIEYGKIGDSVLFLGTEFKDEGRTMNCHFFLIPDYNSYKILLNSLGLSVE